MLSLNHASVQKLHEVADRAAWVSAACFDHTDVAPAVIAKAQECSKAGLREPGPLAYRFELSGGHLNPTRPGGSATVLSWRRVASGYGIRLECAAVQVPWPAFYRYVRFSEADISRKCANIPGRESHPACSEKRSCLATSTEEQNPLLGSAKGLGAGGACARPNDRRFRAASDFIPFGAGNGPAKHVGTLRSVKSVGHFILPCPVEHRSVADEPYIGTMFLSVKHKSHGHHIPQTKG